MEEVYLLPLFIFKCLYFYFYLFILSIYLCIYFHIYSLFFVTPPLQISTLTSELSRLRQALDVQGAGDVVLYGGLVASHHGADGFPQAAQVVEDLQGCAHLSGVLEEGERGGRG